VVVCSSAEEREDLVAEVMECGAAEFVQKPTALALEQQYSIADEIVSKVLASARISPLKLSQLQPEVLDESDPDISFPKVSGRIQAVVIGISTGGPQALRFMLPRFPASFPVPMAIVLHMPVGYTGPIARRLNELCSIEVLEAREGLEMKPGRAILAKAGEHLLLQRGPNGSVRAHLSLNPSSALHRPSVDVLFESAAEAYQDRVLGVVMTGMGSDGAHGAAFIKAAGGMVFTESEKSSVIYGMPRSIVEAGLSDQIYPLEEMPRAIMEAVI
jgi:two-component system chemotaxis response regulator CheB